MVPVDIAFRIERATGGAVKAEEFAGIAPAPETEAELASPAAASQPPAERRSPAGGACSEGAA